jgi:uncharacterized Ntn-hydrolase superfamily protein
LGQDTFSIVAVDTATGEVGSAGASCIDTDDCNGCGGVIIISGLLPGRGAMNSQATACIPNINLNNGLNRLSLGDSPQQALDWVTTNDQCFAGNNTNRQYGIVDIDPGSGQARAVAYTGTNALNYANHIVGDHYAIQGNILLGQAILDSMEARFLRTHGSLAEKLMASLQGANIPGADTRCLAEGVSSKSAFLRVAKPNDPANDFWLDLNVPSTPFGVEPIDSLQTLFDKTGLFTHVAEEVSQKKIALIYPKPAEDLLFILLDNSESGSFLVKIKDVNGKILSTQPLKKGNNTLNISEIAAQRSC